MSEKKAIASNLGIPDLHQVKNPEALGGQEKKLWKKIEPILDELLEELKAKGKIETSYVESKVNHLKSIIENLNMISINNNLLVHIADSIGKARRFVEVVSEFGFTDSSSTHPYVEVSALLSIQNFECFKTLLLFHLRDVDFRAGNFNKTMEKFAQKAWEKLEPYLDNEFRNSLSHGTWAIENKKIVLFKDADLIPFEKLELFQFTIRAKKQNVLYACLFNLIDRKRKEGFFA
ncbi:MAG: hypothetical protein ABSG57_00715 [Candidatus Bathyarchaeia archaeon]